MEHSRRWFLRGLAILPVTALTACSSGAGSGTDGGGGDGGGGGGGGGDGGGGGGGGGGDGTSGGSAAIAAALVGAGLTTWFEYDVLPSSALGRTHRLYNFVSDQFGTTVTRATWFEDFNQNLTPIESNNVLTVSLVGTVLTMSNFVGPIDVVSLAYDGSANAFAVTRAAASGMATNSVWYGCRSGFYPSWASGNCA